MLQAKLEAEQRAEGARAEAEAARSEVAELQSSLHSAQSTDAAVHRLVELLYFSTVSVCHDFSPLQAPFPYTSGLLLPAMGASKARPLQQYRTGNHIAWG